MSKSCPSEGGLTHDELVIRACRWLKKPVSKVDPYRYKPGCGVVVPELVSACSEQPDAIGWTAQASYVIECKTTISDFYADRRKPHRKNGGGVGTYRLYMCPPKVIKVDQLPDGWGLLYAHPKIITVEQWPEPNWDRDLNGEVVMMNSLLRRVVIHGNLKSCLSSKWGGSPPVHRAERGDYP